VNQQDNQSQNVKVLIMEGESERRIRDKNDGTKGQKLLSVTLTLNIFLFFYFYIIIMDIKNNIETSSDDSDILILRSSSLSIILLILLIILITVGVYFYYKNTGKEIPYEAPQPTYEAPQPTYEAPQPTYEAPTYAAPQPTYEAPAYKAPQPTYEAPAYKAPQPTYEAPAYAAPTYAAPQPTYEAPAYKAPQPTYEAPPQPATGLAGPSDTSGYLEYKDVVANLPSSFKLDSLPPTDQYDVATCVTSQVLGIFTYYYWKLFNKEYWFSRLFTWYYDQVDQGGNPSENKGSGTNLVYETIRKRGLLLEKYYQYDGTIPSGPSGDKNTCSTPKYKEKPQDELLEVAKKNIPQFTVYSISITPNLDILKSAIFNGMPILCGISTYASYNSTSTNKTGVISYPDKTKEKKNPGGHQVSLWGWDDDKRIFHLLNTRGSNYMNKGWCTIPYEYILDSELSYSFECFKLNTPVIDIIDDPNYVNKEDWVFRKDLGCPYVNTVQKGVECYEPPPPGYDWTTSGGILIGKTCPPGSIDSGITCWYDRGGGRIPNKRPCADGWRDDGTVCWLDTYSRGVGRDADYEPCPNRSSANLAGDCMANQTDREEGRNDAEHWGKSWDKSDGCSWNRHIEGGMCFRACPEGYFGRAHEKCWANDADSFGVMKRLVNRARTCNADEDKDGLRCYPKCKSGYKSVGCCLCEPDGGIKRIELSARQYCADDEEMKDGFCYKKCKPGFNAGVTICEFSKDVKSGSKKGLVGHCK